MKNNGILVKTTTGRFVIKSAKGTYRADSITWPYPVPTRVKFDEGPGRKAVNVRLHRVSGPPRW